MATRFFCARRTRKMAFELLSCARRIRKAETSLKPPSSIFSPIRSVCIGMIGSLNKTVRVRQISNSDYTSTI